MNFERILKALTAFFDHKRIDHDEVKGYFARYSTPDHCRKLLENPS